ncbi:hypothetical protein [Actinoplanes sp. ATCC 53533]|uniref:hypothetical protein n=1 Tax=Actinoplanes sp. ATCC 53533 TaxID=1288362 RepID=UPI000F7711DF|nr:hypothetical protein [Actinoplanes sp. ATCC 53533]
MTAPVREGVSESAFPKARVLTVSECGTHAMLAAQVGPWSHGEQTLAMPLLSRLRPGELLTADRISTPSLPGTGPTPPALTCCGGYAPGSRYP